MGRMKPQFMLRDLLWLMIVVALAAAWWVKQGELRKAEQANATLKKSIAQADQIIEVATGQLSSLQVELRDAERKLGRRSGLAAPEMIKP